MITRYDPFREAVSLRRMMDQLFEQSFVNPSMMPGTQSMMVPMDVCETPKGYEVDVALPGVRPEDIEVIVDQNALTIRGQFSQQNEHQNQTQGHRQGHNWLSREIVSGSFERTITFPRPLDTNNVQTKFENGILTIMLPMSEASRPKRISITGGQAQQQQPVAVGAGQQH